MNLEEYARSFINNFINTVYNRTGWNIENEVYMKMVTDNREIYAQIFYQDNWWGNIYYGDEEYGDDFELATISPIEIETNITDGSRNEFAKYLSVLGAFIDSAYLNELAIFVRVSNPN